MPDFDGILTALAGRYLAAQVTPPAGGYVNIRSSTGDLPDELGPLPCVVVILDGGTFDQGNQTRLAQHDFLVRFYFAETTDITRQMVALRKWLTGLVDQLRTSTNLSGTVVRAAVTEWRAGVMKYAGRDYSGLELKVHAVTSEPWVAS
jgi:hypothetical protein